MSYYFCKTYEPRWDDFIFLIAAQQFIYSHKQGKCVMIILN